MVINKMNIINTGLEEVKIIELDVYPDDRGWFLENYSEEKYCKLGIENKFVQDNQSCSRNKGILRGIHFQKQPYAQAKLVRCLKGKVLDVAVDLRKNSPTYKKWVAVELSEENKRQLFIPAGFGHAFLTLEDNSEIYYKVDVPYNKAADRSIRYDDPELAIEWPEGDFILSDKDKMAPTLEQSDCDF